MPWKTADVMFTPENDGLKQQWFGRVWLNPPFGRGGDPWLCKMAKHCEGIMLVAARTETQAFGWAVWLHATSVLFLEGRPHFYYPDGKRAPFNSGAPIVLVGYSDYDDERLQSSGLKGHFIKLTPFLKVPTEAQIRRFEKEMRDANRL